MIFDKIIKFYKCPKCGEEFKHKRNYLEHLKKEEQLTPKNRKKDIYT